MHYLFSMVLTMGVFSIVCADAYDHACFFDLNQLESMHDEVPSEGSLGMLSIANLNLNGQGNLIATRAGEKIFCTINFSCNAEYLDSNSLNQIVVGYADLGPRKCILHEFGYRCGGDRITSFFLEAPSQPGTYDIQCSFGQAYSPAEAMRNWNKNNASKLTVGRVIVVE